jgi:hypothetical protein
MTLEGLVSNFSPNEIADWEIATSNHVHDFWDETPFSPLYVGKVSTELISQSRVPTRNSTAESRQFTFEPLEILYIQTASFGLLVEELDPRLVPVEDSVFLEPFRQNSLPYVREIIAITKNPGPVYLTEIEIREPQPTSAPTQAAANSNDARIILIVVFVVGTAVLSAIAYIVYLTRKENSDSPLDGPMALEDYGSDSGNDIYYVNNSPQSPSSTQVLATIGQSASFDTDGIDSPGSVRSGYSDARPQDMDPIADARRRRERSHERSISLPSSSIPSVTDIGAHNASSSSFPTNLEDDDGTDVLEFSPEPSMEGFNMQIEDIED